MSIWPKIMIAPMDRSMPAVRMMSVCAMARVPTITVCWIISEIVEGRRNRSLTRPKMSTTTTRTIRELNQG